MGFPFPPSMLERYSETGLPHQGIGAERKAERLRYLRNRWMERLNGQPGVTINTSFDPAMSCAIGNVGLDKMEPGELTRFSATTPCS